MPTDKERLDWLLGGGTRYWAFDKFTEFYYSNKKYLAPATRSEEKKA